MKYNSSCTNKCGELSSDEEIFAGLNSLPVGRED